MSDDRTPQTTTEPIDAGSRDGITIGLIDAMITLAHTLNDRLQREGRRMKRREDWEWFSEPVQLALAELAGNKAILQLIRPDDETAMEIIRLAAALIETSEASTP